MALFQSYAPPGVYTSVVISPTSAPLFGLARIPVIIGEGVENFVFTDQEIFRGSSSSADDQSVNEDLSAQVTGTTRTFQTTYFPVTNGNGTGTVTNDYTLIKVTSNGIPVTVVSLAGSTGVFMTQQIIPVGATLLATYFFKRTDTHIVNEDLSDQIPTFASLVYTPAVGHSITISLNTPGELGNNVTLQFTLASSPNGVSDALAVTGAGTNAISIELLKADNTTVRTLTDISNLIAAGIPTGQGYLTGHSTDTQAGVAQAAAPFTGGNGPSTNTTFNTAFAPIVDGTNGGVITNDVTDIQVLVAGVAAPVASLDGADGQFTLVNGVISGQTLTVTYFTNTWQNTFDLLPGSNIVQIDKVGLGPGRADFTNGVDYVLVDNKIYWGAATSTAQGLSTPGFTPLSAVQITTTLRDEHVYLVPASGAANGINAVFTSAFIPTDGSGLGKSTNDPSLIKVYIGTDPVSAQSAGAVTVTRLIGATGVFTLYNPPMNGDIVYVSGTRSILNDHEFTVEVVNPGIPGQGSFSIVDELGRAAINVEGTTAGSSGTSVADANFANLGIVWPFNAPDIEGALGGADETITLTFQQDGHTRVVTPGVQSSATVPQTGSDALKFKATNTGTGPNGTTSVTVISNGTQPVLAANLVYNSIGTFSGSTGTATAFPVWQASHAYTAGQIIFDATSASIQVVTTPGTSGNVKPGTTYVLTAAATAVAGNTTYTGTISGVAPAAGLSITISGFVTSANNGTFTVVSATGTTLVVNNAAGAAETHAGSALIETAFSATAGVATTDGGAAFTSNGLAPTTVEQLFVNISSTTTATLSLNNVLALFTGVIGVSGNVVATAAAGQIIATLGAGSVGTDNAIAHAVVNFSGGVNVVTDPTSNRFVVSSSRTSAQALADGLGRTGNATTPAYANFATKLDARNTLFSTNDTIVDTHGNIQIATVGGTSAGSEPVWATSGTTTDGSVTWTFVGALVGLDNFLGESYLDPNTAVKFTIVDPNNALPYGYTQNPSPAYFFAPGDKVKFILARSTDMSSAFITGVTPTIAIPGVKTTVATTFGMNAGDNAIITTFNKSGNNPNVGEFYYVTFETAKQDSDFAIQIFENAADAYAVYGIPNTTNRLSLAIQLLTQNGAQQFGAVQVKKQPGTPVASDQAFINAIQSLASPLPGSNNYAAVIVPLSTSPTVQQFMSRFLITQAAPRIQAEAIGFVGFDQYTTTSAARQAARSFLNSRIIAVAPFVAGVLISPTNATGVGVEQAVDGPFLAAAMAGLEVNPANDVATTLTNQQVVGFTRLLGKILDNPTMDQMAADGLTLLLNNNGSLLVRHYKSTDPSNVLTSEPTSTTVTDYVRQQFRTALDQFIGRKFVGTLVNDVTAVCNSLLRTLVNQEIIAGYKNLSVIPDPSDPTLLDITLSFQPIFSLLYISVTFTVTTNL